VENSTKIAKESKRKKDDDDNDVQGISDELMAAKSISLSKTKHFAEVNKTK